MKYLIVVAVLCFISSVTSQCLLGNSPTSANNLNCTWYNAKTCCDEQLADAGASAAVVEFQGGCSAPATKCQQLLTLFGCGICSPDFTSAISGTTINICSSFVDHVYSSCSDSQFGGNGNCQTLSAQYSSSKAWFASGPTFGGALLVYDSSDSSPKCFNAGSVSQPILLLIIAALALLLKF